jgi:hypothetical protein
MRAKIVSELAKELLGPRKGIREILAADPKNEYITGVLAPQFNKAEESDPDKDAELLVTDEEGEEDSTEEDVFSVPLLSPVLDPKSTPRSIGLSFIVESEKPLIKICATWAKYLPQTENKWKREPKFFVTDFIDCKSITKLIKPYKENNSVKVAIHILTRPIEEKRYEINVFLVDEEKIDSKDPVTSKDYLFQPQIRVKCGENTVLVPKKMYSSDVQEQQLEFLYRNKHNLARGYMCSAMWKDIDPERKHPKIVNNDIPFKWIDGDALPKEDKNEFMETDVRTEFLPLYPVEAPTYDWNIKFGKKPELDTEKLAELYNAECLDKALKPLVEGYDKWINDSQIKIKGYTSEQQKMYQDNIDRCKYVCDRIKSGIKLLMDNEDARLSFCIANKAISIQYSWSKKKALSWYPYQLAFILMTIESLANPDSDARRMCDLLWVPTGAGKTEAYLAISAFMLLYRRRIAIKKNDGSTGAGIGVISRYTLRLLTIQQFRRTLGVITALEYLRVFGLKKGMPVGWRPPSYKDKTDFLLGTTRFSIGLWVGGGVTPNSLKTTWPQGENKSPIWGAVDILKGKSGEGEPAQVLNCPACKSILAVPDSNRISEKVGLKQGSYTLHWICSYDQASSISNLNQLVNYVVNNNITINKISFIPEGKNYGVLTAEISVKIISSAKDIDNFWNMLSSQLKKMNIIISNLSVRASRPGYFLKTYMTTQKNERPVNFEIYCPNPDCDLNKDVWWVEGVPITEITSIGIIPHEDRELKALGGLVFNQSLKYFRDTIDQISNRIPIPALTVDDQIYHFPPSFLVATADKFARMPFEPRCSALFGNVTHYHARWGYYRPYNANKLANDAYDNLGNPKPISNTYGPLYTTVQQFEPPSLIIQDELHLLEGPLGSMVGIYETVVDSLCCEKNNLTTKYIASTATISKADDQITSLFARDTNIFPPAIGDNDDRFFIRFTEPHPLDDTRPGRLYMGVCAPGKGPLTPNVRIWSRLLKTVNDLPNASKDNFWTVTGYFNAIRELAGAIALYRDDIPERLHSISTTPCRPINDDNRIELSSRTESTYLPTLLDDLSKSYPDAKDALFTTSMFGTGIDISRLGLMVVNGQPKSTSSYIQATGRVGRQCGALIVTFLRSTRPRDLNHYEYFCGYHRSLYKNVEPVSVSPFSKGALARSAGPIIVSYLRNKLNSIWYQKDDANKMAVAKNKSSPAVINIAQIMETRANQMPLLRKPATGEVLNYIRSEIDKWEYTAKNYPDIKWYEYFDVNNPVVLGDPSHKHAGKPTVFDNAPQSLREIEETMGFNDYG